MRVSLPNVLRRINQTQPKQLEINNMEAIKEIEQTEPPEIPEAVQTLLRKIGLEEFHAQLVIGGLEVGKVDEVVTRLTAKKALVVVNDEGDVTGMTVADTLRKEAKKARCDLEKNRESLKEIPKKQGQLIDGIAKHYKGIIEPLEDYFEAQATFAKRQQEKRVAELVGRRKVALGNVGISTAFLDVASMPEEDFNKIIEEAEANNKKAEEEAKRQKELHDERYNLLLAEGVNPEYLPLGTMPDDQFQQRLATAKQAKADKAEADRKAAEATAEAERLWKEQAEKDAQAKKDLEDAKAKQDAAEAELLAKKQQEQEEANRKAEEARKLLEGPEIDRVMAFAKTLRAVVESAPVLRSQRLNEEVDDAVLSINEIIENLEALCEA